MFLAIIFLNAIPKREQVMPPGRMREGFTELGWFHRAEP